MNLEIFTLEINGMNKLKNTIGLYEYITKFINEHRIKRQDILCILPGEYNSFVLFYYDETIYKDDEDDD